METHDIAWHGGGFAGFEIQQSFPMYLQTEDGFIIPLPSNDELEERPVYPEDKQAELYFSSHSPQRKLSLREIRNDELRAEAERKQVKTDEVKRLKQEERERKEKLKQQEFDRMNPSLFDFWTAN